MAGARSSYPAGGLGYWRGSDYLYGGSGSGMGTVAQGTGTLGQGLGSVGKMAGQWEPSVLYLLGLIVVEMFVFGWIGRTLR